MTTDMAPTRTTTVHQLPVLLTIEDVAEHLGVTVRHWWLSSFDQTVVVRVRQPQTDPANQQEVTVPAFPN